MPCILAIGMTVAMVSAAGLAPAAEAVSKPRRVVSLNLCADELVLRLAEPKNIASVTWLARGSGSNVTQIATEVPVNHGLAEEIIPLDPDLVFAGIYTTRMAVALLKRTSIPLKEIDIPTNIESVRRQYREVAELLGEREKGELIVADMDARLAKLPPAPPTGRPRAVVLNPNGFTVGRDSLPNEIMTRAGLDNVATEIGMASYAQMALEIIVTKGVDVLIVSNSRDGPPAMATEILKHPVISRIADRTRVVTMPTRMWNCAGPVVVDAIELLMSAANEVRAKRQRE